VRAALAPVLAVLSLAVSARAQDVRKLATLATTSEAEAVAVCGETGLVAVLGHDGAIAVWRLPSGEQVARRPAEDGARSLACSADGMWLAIGKRDGSVAIADVSGTPIRTFSVDQHAVYALAFSPDKSLLAVELGGPTQLWDPARGVMVAALETDFAGGADMAFSPDGSLFATADFDTAVRIYDRAGKLKAKYTGLLLSPFTVRFLPDGKQLVVGGADCTLTILDAADGHVVRALPKQPDPVFAAAILPSGARLLSLHIDATALKTYTTLLWDLRSGTAHALPIDGSNLKGFGVTANHLPVLFLADSKTSLTAWALAD